MADTETVTPRQVPVPTTPEEFALMPIRKNTRISTEKKLSEAIPKVPTPIQSSEQTVVVRDIEFITKEILHNKERAGEAIIEIGKLLIEAKKKLNHGEWLPWLRNKVDFSEVTAQRYMRIAKEFSNPSLAMHSNLDYTKASVLLSLPVDKRKNFIIESHNVNGIKKNISEMSRRELINSVREYKKRLEAEQLNLVEPSKRQISQIASEKSHGNENGTLKEPDEIIVDCTALFGQFKSLQICVDTIIENIFTLQKNPQNYAILSGELRSLCKKILSTIP